MIDFFFSERGKELLFPAIGLPLNRESSERDEWER